MAKAVSPLLRWTRRTVSALVPRRGRRLSEDVLLILCECAENGGFPLSHPAYPENGIKCVYTLETKSMIRKLEDSGYMYEYPYNDGDSPRMVVTPEGEERALREIRKRESSSQGRVPIPRIRLEWR
ncbi:MAG: hypothetical protein F4Y50_06850 [Dehalococcoidia bacterium]|nr:hypothetical protein [Dehalococcoidia bacterium]